MHNSMFGAFSVLYRYSNRYAIKRMKETGIDKCHPPYLLAVAQNEGCGQEDIARTMHIDKGRIAKVTILSAKAMSGANRMKTTNADTGSI